MTRAVPADEAVRGGPRDQVLELPAPPLGGDREAPVLDEGAWVGQVGDVLPGGPPPCGMTALDGLRAGRVLGQGAALEDLRQVLALGARSAASPSSPIRTSYVSTDDARLTRRDDDETGDL